MPSDRERICLGVIAGAHGVRGAVRIKAFTAEPRAIAAYGPLSDEAGARRFEIEVIGESRGRLIARIEGIRDREAAEALKGLELYVARAALPEPGEDEHYHADLVGLRVELRDGGALGTVRAVHDFGAGHLLDIELESGGSVMIPFTKRAVPEVDVAGGRLVADPPEGLIEGAEDAPAGGRRGHGTQSMARGT